MASRQLRSHVIPGGNRVLLPKLKSPVAPNVQTPCRSYSDVAASRPSSPSAEVEKMVGNETPKLLVENINENNENPFVLNEQSDPDRTSSESESDNNGPWTTVQNPAIDKGKKSLTQEQQKLIAKRNKKVCQEHSSSCGKGPSKDKGKAIDL
ncbi:hypothetical protein CVT25_008387 [Psilocybe cyanescens]|uniref:Uncharacterized protein n=1 Tax=Psilocybe cyanescens TaxID=93625 RepID=A0A409XVE0_PSICY|nr:hypothetical protein CVT25_008387 [Psilocybe cyanescens]